MKPPIEFVQIESPARRRWVLSFDPEAMHRAIRGRLFLLNTKVTGVSVGIRPEKVSSLGELLSRALTEPRQAPPLPGTVLDDLIGVVKGTHRGEEALSIQRLVHVLERVTIDLLHFTINSAALRARPGLLSEWAALVEKTLSPLGDWDAKWAAWCASPAPRDLSTLTEYEYVHAALSKLEPATSVSCTLYRRIGSRGGKLRLEGWSVALRAGWQERSDPEWSRSEWAIFLIAEKHATHARAIKKELANQRLERQIGEAWSRYGTWLAQHPDALHEFEVLLGVPLSLVLETASKSVPTTHQ